MNIVNNLFNIKYPIVQGGMVWCSGWKLASAVSNAGGLGLIGAGSMRPSVLEEHIKKCKKATSKPFGVNLPLLYSQIDKHLEIILREKVKIIFTSAGNPMLYTNIFKKNNITVVHVVSSKKFAVKAFEAGVDAIVAEGFEAGGHNGVNETTTMCLIPEISKSINIPVIAAGGIASGKSMLAALSLGANGVQIGSRFAVCKESSSHKLYKNYVFDSKEGDTKLTLKELTPVRLLRNEFFYKIQKAYQDKVSANDLKEILAKGRAKKGIFEGDLINGELEIGQVSSMISKEQTAKQIIDEIINEFNKQKLLIKSIKLNK